MKRFHNICSSLRTSIFIGLFCLFIGFNSSAQTTPVILIMGDSLSAEYGLPRGSGWVNLLQQQLIKEASQWTVLNVSISGETSAGGLHRLGNLLNQKKPGLVVLELGANDALRGLPITETKNNLRKMIQMSKKSGAKVLLLGMQIPPNYGQNYTNQFRGLFSNLAKEEDVALLPFFLSDVADRAELFQADRLHPNVEAQSILFKNVWGSMAPYKKMLKT